MRYDKLVRDKILEHILQSGGNPTFHIADEAEYWDKLKEKLLEEVQEFNKDESIEEYADILEVLRAIALHKGFNSQAVESVRSRKAQERGAFQKKIILEES